MQLSNIKDREEINGQKELSLSPINALSKLYSLWVGKENSSLCLPIRSEGKLKYFLSEKETKRMEWMLTEAAENFLREGSISREGWNEKALAYISSDNMAAWLLLLPPVGNSQRLTTFEIEQQLAAQGVTFGLDRDLLSVITRVPNPYFSLFLIACGEMPINGKDGYVVDRIPRKLRPFSDPDELANMDYNMLHLVSEIQKGDIICEITPPTQAVPGKTVRGTPIPGYNGVKAEIPAGRNTTISEDGKYLVAMRSGHVQFSGRNFFVKAVLDIPGNVDQSTGDIHFLGDIHIHGDVTDGCIIRAMGNIQIDGVIEVCTIEAGENIVVSSGVQGQDQTLIRAHKSVYAKYLEYCTVYAHDMVQADCIIDCKVNCNGTVRVRAGRGVIIGGTICATKQVTATTIGSRVERLTSIILGGLPCEEFERQQILDECNKIKEEIDRTQRQPMSVERENTLAKLNSNLRIAKIKLERFDKESQAEAAKQRLENCSLSVDTVYPQLSVTIEHQSVQIGHIQNNYRIGWYNGRLQQIHG